MSGDNVDCWMEIQHGKGPWASPVSGIVPLGTTLTMVVGINDKQGELERIPRTRSECDARTSGTEHVSFNSFRLKLFLKIKSKFEKSEKVC